MNSWLDLVLHYNMNVNMFLKYVNICIQIEEKWKQLIVSSCSSMKPDEVGWWEPFSANFGHVRWSDV